MYVTREIEFINSFSSGAEGGGGGGENDKCGRWRIKH